VNRLLRVVHEYGWITAVVGILSISTLLPAEAQQAKVYRVGWVFLSSPGEEPREIVDALREGLRQHGYAEGRNFAFEFRWTRGIEERLDALTAELVKVPVDMIVAGTSQNAHAAKRATTTIPILLIGPDPLSSGLVTNLARPGGNITGFTALPGPALAGKYVQLVKEALPLASRLAILWNEASVMQPVMLREASLAAKALSLNLQTVGFRHPDEFDRAVRLMRRQGAEAVIVLPDAVTFIHRRRLAELASSYGLPSLFAHTEAAVAGGLIAYSANTRAIARRAGHYVDQIFRGERPGDLPVEQPTVFELVINLKTAKALGLTLSPALLVQADRVLD